TVTMRTEVTRPADGALILSGKALVMAPRLRFDRDDIEVPGLIVQRHRHFEALLERARPLPPMRTAVVAPEDERSLSGALLAWREGLITPTLIGDPALIAAAAGDESLAGIEIIDEPDHLKAAAR